ncbi:MAG: restriction endonuclease [candidate division WOR-3 bacterium]|jgi:hypothetical protein
MKSDLVEKLKPIIDAYNVLVKGIEVKARNSQERAYGGIIRAGKGKLVESIGKELIKISWEELGRDLKRISFSSKIVKVPINKAYLNRIKSKEVREYIQNNIKDFYYPLKSDIHLFIDDEFKMAVECKAYTENAMLKRILVDFTLLKQVYPKLKFVLLQLESQLGGDYSSGKLIKYGSPSTHTLLSYFDIDLNIITLLEGERKVERPIHKPQFFKPLKISALINAVDVFKELLKEFK